VFIADISTSTPRITLAQQGILVSEGPDKLHLHLSNGSTHEVEPEDPGFYRISTFQQWDIPISFPQAGSKQEEEPAPIAQLSTWNLPREARKTNEASARWYNIEFHRRFALPAACLVLALVGIPLGLSSKKGGKSAGFVLTIVLVLVYYSVSLLGVSFARQGKIPPSLGAWLADIVFFLGGAILLWRAERKPFEITWRRWHPFAERWKEVRGTFFRGHRTENAFARAEGRRRLFAARFPTILDDYVLREFAVYLGLVLVAFLMLFLVFTVFDLLGDILRNQISPLIVGEYLLNVAPFYLYIMLPLRAPRTCPQ
jgi:lipopolysaccharide export LptBFGC system permease protein LptF